MRPTPSASTQDPSFDRALFAFLADLRDNNDRSWFAANKTRYEQACLEPALAFVEDFAVDLDAISPHFRADPRPVGGSLFRIHRDTRFSRDKSPYKTNIGIHFRHEAAGDVHAPGFYLHLAPGEVFAGGGIWHPGSEAIGRIRAAIVGAPDRWIAVTRSKAFRARLELGGDTLKRPPAGFDAEHPLIDDLKRKDVFGGTQLAERDACSPRFLEDYGEICRAAAPLVQFICDALELPF
jgi:uncharacterized protein (TIGR02453 family)